MISQKANGEVSKDAKVGWITALRRSSIRTLLKQRHLQQDLFDERNLLEIRSPNFPGERPVACRNPESAKLRVQTRNDLLAAAQTNLDKLKAQVDANKIGVAVGDVVNQYKAAKHFELTIADDAFTFARMVDSIALEAALEGLYIICTFFPPQRMDAGTCVRTYKSLAQLERAFRSVRRWI